MGSARGLVPGPVLIQKPAYTQLSEWALHNHRFCITYSTNLRFCMESAVHSWLNLWMQNPQIQKANSILFFFKEIPDISVSFPDGKVVKNPPANAGDTRNTGSIPASERSPRERNNNPLQYSCLDNSMGRGAWQTPLNDWAHTRVDPLIVQGSTVFEGSMQSYLISFAPSILSTFPVLGNFHIPEQAVSHCQKNVKTIFIFHASELPLHLGWIYRGSSYNYMGHQKKKALLASYWQSQRVNNGALERIYFATYKIISI